MYAPFINFVVVVNSNPTHAGLLLNSTWEVLSHLRVVVGSEEEMPSYPNAGRRLINEISLSSA